MSQQPVIMVQVNEPQWMQDVLNCACQSAESCGGRIILIVMERVEHISDVGSNVGHLQFDEQERRMLQTYANTVAARGIGCDVELYQYWDMFGGIAEAAREMGATVVFAKLPRSRIPFWSASRFEVLRQHMAHAGQQLLDRGQNGTSGGDGGRD
jgi:hypothetical protein